MNTYNHNQTEASDEWVINHGLNAYPVSDVQVDMNGKRMKILPKAVEYVDPDTLVVHFSEPLTGSVRLVAQFGFVLDHDDPTVDPGPTT